MKHFRMLLGLSLLQIAWCSAASAAPLCTIMADAASGKVVNQAGNCDQRLTPASTFKIALSLMGYDSGYLTNEHLPTLPFHEGYPDWIDSWRAPTDPTSWIKNSVVWYSQQITEWLGEERFRTYLAKFDYGNQDASGDPGKNNGLTQAWLSSSLKISAREQLIFLEKLVSRRLPVSPNAYDMTTRITLIGVLANGWEIHGKTGTGTPVKTDNSPDPKHSLGWFVGWASKGDRTLAFVRCIQETEGTTRAGLVARDAFMRELPALLDSL